jgi:PAS domain S-box-containing protein
MSFFIVYNKKKAPDFINDKLIPIIMADLLNHSPSFNATFERFYKNSLDKIQQGILFINEDGTLAEANAAFKAIHGWDENTPIVISESLQELYTIFDLDYNMMEFGQWPINKLINRVEFQDEKYILQINETGRKFYASYSGFPQYDEFGNYAGGIFMLSDTTELINTRSLLEKEVDKKNKYYHELEQFQQQLKADRSLLQSIIDTIPVMITIYDRQFESIILNRAFVDIAGWTNEDAKQTNIMELAYPDPQYRAEVYEFVSTLSPGFKDILLRTKDGRFIETSWANVSIPDGRQVGVGLDISDRKKMENELIAAREKAVKASQVQLAFIQSISHEVRTPMNSILGYTELLYKQVKEPKGISFLDAVSHNGKQLLRLIDDIIDFSRLDNKQLAIQKEEVHIQSLITKIKKQIPGIKKNYNKKHIKVLFSENQHSEEDIRLHSDEIRLQQILINLISNGIQYSEMGQVEVGYELRNHQNEILFYVKDTGIGIKQQDYPKVFSRFTRFHDTTRNEVRGTGLGLAICKHLVELMGGRIWFESEPGKGSVFYFTHPLVHKNILSPKAVIGKENFHLPDLKKISILIVEDDIFSFTMMHHMLSETGANIIHAENGINAIEMINKNTVDFVFLDIRLPGIDGYAVLEHIRKVNKYLPVVAQTANAMPEDRERVKAAGFTAYITKPVSQKDLYAVINKHLKINQKSIS